MTCHGGRLVLRCCWNRSTKKLEMRRLYLVSAGRNLYVRTLCARYVCMYLVPGISRLPRYVVYDTRYVDTSILVHMFWPPLLLNLLLLLLCRRRRYCCCCCCSSSSSSSSSSTAAAAAAAAAAVAVAAPRQQQRPAPLRSLGLAVVSQLPSVCALFLTPTDWSL